ncbi:iron uptake porin [Gloeocapsopsis dulcis]|uniref:Porin n=1 Tax=Gloeocapsopsis dulcis AAB1 = 1H9 TaxID=1433147 RepID=A0A6N8G0P3_9CHRO|nr:iron uptake porin [Gloeocapsopsis dulcis]MUL38462.1 porin [Gloeocapsopsis dulcis AAB1 = 1H9]WNN88823.1 iron uptake porin [Gloeocapsopsis dulcis]
MPRRWWNTWYWFGVISWVALTFATPVKANSMTQPNPCTTFDGCSSGELPPENKVVEAPMTHVPAVSKLVDEIAPTDWEVQALLSLSRYGVLLGFPDRTFRSDRSLTRYEFAIVLNQVLNQVNTLIANEAEQFSQEDLITLQQLQRDYNSVLQEIRTQLDTLGDRANELTSTQFSITTKLNGEVILGFTEGTDANATLVSRQRLNLLTSFSPRDLLLTQLEAGNRGQDAISVAHNRAQNLLGTSGLLVDGGGLEYAEIDDTLRLRRLYYTFHPSANLAVTLGAKMSPSDFIDRNRSANNPAVDFSSSFLINNPLIVQNQIDREGGAGAAVAWNINGGSFTVRSLYIAADGNQPNSTTPTQGGLFYDRYQGSVELEYSSRANLAVRLQYTNAVINNIDIQAAGINAEYAFNRNAAVYGRFGFGSYQGFNTAVAQELDLNPSSWAVGLTVRNLAIPGTIAGIAFGQPFIEDDLGNATQTNVEAFYNLTLSENISVTPALQLVKHANNDRSSGTIWQGTLRTVFSF